MYIREPLVEAPSPADTIKRALVDHLRASALRRYEEDNECRESQISIILYYNKYNMYAEDFE